jgi:hypothetical protein
VQPLNTPRAVLIPFFPPRSGYLQPGLAASTGSRQFTTAAAKFSPPVTKIDRLWVSPAVLLRSSGGLGEYKAHRDLFFSLCIIYPDRLRISCLLSTLISWIPSGDWIFHWFSAVRLRIYELELSDSVVSFLWLSVRDSYSDPGRSLWLFSRIFLPSFHGCICNGSLSGADAGCRRVWSC